MSGDVFQILSVVFTFVLSQDKVAVATGGLHVSGNVNKVENMFKFASFAWSCTGAMAEKQWTFETLVQCDN